MAQYHGACETRVKVACSLDAYLLLIVDAIEDGTGRKFDQPADLITAHAEAPFTIH